MKIFGLWGSNEVPHTPVPVGHVCLWCEEIIAKSDLGVVIPHIDARGFVTERAQHRDCFLRQVVGSLAHQEKKCSCFGGAHEDDPALTKRQAAAKAVAFFTKRL